MTPAEASLWTTLKDSKLGVKFRRQHGVGPYVVDFYCPEFSLAVELEGQGHMDEIQRELDARRGAYLRSVGIRVLYFENRAVYRRQLDTPNTSPPAQRPVRNCRAASFGPHSLKLPKTPPSASGSY